MSQGLSADQIRQYRTEGYVVIDSMFDSKSLAAVNQAIQELTAKAVASPAEMKTILELEPDPVDGERVARRVFNPFDQHPAFRNLATDERLLDSIESLIGPDINLQHSKLNMKPAKVGSVVDWHQDLAYFPHTNDDLVTTLIYLDDATIENGCLQVIPRHHYAFFNHTDAEGKFVGMITEDLSGDKYGRSVPLTGSAGSVIFMHCMLPHSSLPNRSSKARRTLIFEYRAADSFPIYYGKMTAVAEAQVRLLRGQPANYARFGGPQPLIPRVDEYSSLYDLQGKAKQKTAAVAG